jgi:hypothetical protein
MRIGGGLDINRCLLGRLFLGARTQNGTRDQQRQCCDEMFLHFFAFTVSAVSEISR